ncbi:hypothetical protein EES41_01805 [Streptomyces sp. ADI95-16]|nr:hypothetical protein EES41_01805 [Streptomyces sp. ADI95-16]
MALSPGEVLSHTETGYADRVRGVLGDGTHGAPVRVSTEISPCGFAPMRGAGSRDDTPAPLDGLERAAERWGPVRLPKGADPAAVVRDHSPACLMTERREHDEANGSSTCEFGVQGFGTDGKAVADAMAAAVHTWDRELWDRAKPRLTVMPAGTPDSALPAGYVVEKSDCRVVIGWPGRAVTRPPALPLDGTRHKGGATSSDHLDQRGLRQREEHPGGA